ncbi:MAG TPA: tetratricopeptide repeat protein [Terriglobales bacterium]|nr:tetratricopeptide repeat protein [Terriglobales bacterium]
MALKVAPRQKVTEDPRHTQAVQNYESGLRALQEHKYEKAKGHLQKVLAGPNKSFADRAQVHILTCDKHLDAPSLQFKTTEEHYDYAVSLINTGDYVAAREHLDKLLKQQPKSEYVLYGLAALHCLTGHVEESLKMLDEAIQVRPALRFQARNDGDFQNLAEDPRFTELLYPDPGAGESEPQEEEASAY